MKLVEVTTPAHQKAFLKVAVDIYKNQNSDWIRPLDKDINDVFDRKQNKLFKQKGEAIRWLLDDGTGKYIGRVAAFVNPKTSKKGGQPTGGMGFFECINDQKAAFMLFDACKEWLEARGMEAMDGPINFGERDAWWGLLAKGFDIEPNYRCQYNFPYYVDFFEAYGFQVYFKQLTYGRKVMQAVSEKIKKKAQLIAQDPNYHFKHVEKDKLDKYAEDFTKVYNAAWGNHGGVAKLDVRMAKMMMKQFKPVMDPKIMWFAYYKDEPAAMFISLPELNQLFKYVNGKMDWWGKAKFMYYKMTGACKKSFGLVFGVAPEHQGKGLDGALIERYRRMVQEEAPVYEDFEMNWIGDFNPKMILVAEQVVGDISKVHHTYRKLFDETKEFKRMPMIG